MLKAFFSRLLALPWEAETQGRPRKPPRSGAVLIRICLDLRLFTGNAEWP